MFTLGPMAQATLVCLQGHMDHYRLKVATLEFSIVLVKINIIKKSIKKIDKVKWMKETP